MRGSVYVNKVNMEWTNEGVIHIKCMGNFSSVAQAAREICEAIVRGNNPWWFETIEGKLTEEASQVDDMSWEIVAKFGM